MHQVIERTPTIETRRLELRAPRINDAERIAGLACDIDVARMTCRMPYPFQRRDAEACIARAEAMDPGREAAFAVVLEDEGVIGMVGIHPGEPSRSGLAAPEIGYWLGRAYWGRGLATEAVSGALSWARTVWRKRVVAAGHFADNPASGRVLENAGFLYTGAVEPRRSRARGEIVDMRMMVWLA